MNVLETLHANLQTFDIRKIINKVLQRSDVGEFVIKVIQDRLYNEGKTATGDKLKTDFAKSVRFSGTQGAYARSTEKFKKLDGLPTDRVTLFQTGEFYDSFKKEFKSNSLQISAEFRNIYDNFQDSFSSQQDFEKAIIGLTDEDLKRIFEFIYPFLAEEINKWLAIA